MSKPTMSKTHINIVCKAPPHRDEITIALKNSEIKVPKSTHTQIIEYYRSRFFLINRYGRRIMQLERKTIQPTRSINIFMDLWMLHTKDAFYYIVRIGNFSNIKFIEFENNSPRDEYGNIRLLSLIKYNFTETYLSLLEIQPDVNIYSTPHPYLYICAISNTGAPYIYSPVCKFYGDHIVNGDDRIEMPDDSLFPILIMFHEKERRYYLVNLLRGLKSEVIPIESKKN